jgi:hypothetical protein
MGLFSRQKPVSATGIPKEILDEVTVNGEKKNSPSVITQESVPQEQARETTSPFFNKPEKQAKVLPQTTEDPGPKPFQFADQVSPDGAIHFAEQGTNQEVEEDQLSLTEEAKKVPDFSRIAADPAVQAAESPLSDVALSKARPFFSRGNIISIVVFFLILALISGGSWYYLNTRSAIGNETTESINELEILTEEVNKTGLQTISTDQPNYLRLDVESVSLTDIQDILQKEAQKITEEEVTVPVEYLVTDLNNNPVAFSRFALLANANVPDVLVNASREPFSLYLFQEAGALKLALAVALDEGAQSSLEPQVSEVAQSLKNFLLPEAERGALPAALSFNQADYNNQKVYYYNVSEASELSFDITFEDEYIVIANSKSMLRAVFDKRN